MPFKSKAQMRLFFAKQKRGEISRKTLDKFLSETEAMKDLPERKKKDSSKRKKARRRA